MKTKPMILIAVMLYAGPCHGQDAEKVAAYEKEWDQSAQNAVLYYPDSGKSESEIAKKIGEYDRRLKDMDSPIYYSPKKPFIICQIVAEQLGVKPTSPIPVNLMQVISDAFKTDPRIINVKTQKETAPFDTTPKNGPIPELNGYKSVRVTAVEPDGIRIMHESGAAKIGIEKLDEAQRTKYGLTVERAKEYRRRVAINTAAYAQQEQDAYMARAEAAKRATELAEQERQAKIEAINRANNPRVWKRFVDNEDVRRNEREAIAVEIRMTDGPEAADRFLMQEKLKDIERSVKNNLPEENGPTTRLQNGNVVRQNGDRLTINGDLVGGYRIRGSGLYSVETGERTHNRSGSSWIPIDPSQPRIDNK